MGGPGIEQVVGVFMFVILSSWPSVHHFADEHGRFPHENYAQTTPHFPSLDVQAVTFGVYF